MNGIRLSSVTIMCFNHNSLIAVVLNDLAILPRDCNSTGV